ncbi:MAG: hypothetical protein U5S82_00350 [Gammaproteobacteria bacterium]|nr:hypothetical protein [Gammaproteobacteria bacterium]
MKNQIAEMVKVVADCEGVEFDAIKWIVIEGQDVLSVDVGTERQEFPARGQDEQDYRDAGLAAAEWLQEA